MDILPADNKATVKCIAHRLPCNVGVDTPAPTARAFCPFPGPLQSFRGRKLQSGQLSICDSSQLVLVERQQTDSPNRTSNTALSVKYILESNGFFYQQDEFPDTNSTVPRALGWLSVACALHDPVDTTDINININEGQTTEASDDKICP